MIALLQRVTAAQVSVGGETIGAIQHGLLVLLDRLHPGEPGGHVLPAAELIPHFGERQAFRLLEQRQYIEEKGRAGGPGQPILYGTTELFLDRMGLAALEDLPPIEEFMPPIETANRLVEEMGFDVDESSEVS